MHALMKWDEISNNKFWEFNLPIKIILVDQKPEYTLVNSQNIVVPPEHQVNIVQEIV